MESENRIFMKNLKCFKYVHEYLHTLVLRYRIICWQINLWYIKCNGWRRMNSDINESSAVDILEVKGRHSHIPLDLGSDESTVCGLVM